MLEEQVAFIDDYWSFFGFSRKRSGYSGVATYCSTKSAPSFAQEGIGGSFGNSLQLPLEEQQNSGFNEQELKDLDAEGRSMISQYYFEDQEGKEKILSLINVYCPRADPEKPERKIYKLKFYQLLKGLAIELSSVGSVVIVGDINTSHKRIDHCDPDESDDFDGRKDRQFLNELLLDIHCDGTCSTNICDLQNDSETGITEDNYDFVGSDTCSKKSSNMDHKNCDRNGTIDKLENNMKNEIKNEDEQPCPEVNKRLCDNCFSNCDLLSVTDFQMIDTLRYFHPLLENQFTCWNTERNARATNFGTRLDYCFCTKDLQPFLSAASIHPDIMGSDHCPVSLQLKGLTLRPTNLLPKLCTKYFPEFQGSQQKLKNYFKVAEKDNHISKMDSGNFTRNSDNLFPTKRKLEQMKGVHSKKSTKKGLSMQKSLNSYFTKRSSAECSNDFCTSLDSSSNSSIVNNDPSTHCSDVDFSKTNGDIAFKKNEFPSSFSQDTPLSNEKYKPINITKSNDITISSDIKNHSSPTEHLESQNHNMENSEFKKSGKISFASHFPNLRAKIPEMKEFDKNEVKPAWGFLMKGPKPAPNCPGHKEPSALRTVKKKGPNFNRQFYACNRGAGKVGDPNAQCNFFQWA